MRNLLLSRVYSKDPRRELPHTWLTGLALARNKYGVNGRPLQGRIPRMSDFDEISVTLADGYGAYARFWEASKPRGAVLYHHGIQSHCGWYEASARHIVENGFSVLQVDRRGSGRNEQDRGHAESADQLICDAQAARDVLLQRTGFETYHVVGVSWGGKLAVCSYVADPCGICSLSLVAPGLFPQDGVSGKTKQEIGFAMLYEPQRRFDIPHNEPKLFTSDPTWQEFFRSDPQTLRQCSAAFYLASRRMDRTVAKLSTMPPVAIHLILVGQEHIIDNEKTLEFIDKLDWPECKKTHYESSLHSVEFEKTRDRFFGDLVGFIGKAAGN